MAKVLAKKPKAKLRISLREQAYEMIKRRIITLAYKPGSYLNEAMISTDLGLGKSPVRQAIDLLRLEGMVEVIPRKGVIVSPLSLQEIRDINEVRIVNESYCASLAAERASDQEIARLEAILEKGIQAANLRDIETQMELDREFHGTIASAARNPVLAELLRNLHERALRFWFVSLTEPTHGKRIWLEHKSIVDAIKQCSAEKAEKAMASHIESFRNNVTQQL